VIGSSVGLSVAALAAVTVAAVSFAQEIAGPVEPTGETENATGWQAIPVVDGLEHPWAIAFLPGSEADAPDMLVTERPGRLRVVTDGQLRDEPVEGLPEIFANGQGGLMDVSLHPQFEETRWVYLTYSAGTRNANHTQLARGTLNEDMTALEDVEVLFEVNHKKPGGQHFGSRIEWMPDNTFLLSIGDGGNPPVEVDGKLARWHAPDLSSHLGKILRLDEYGKPAPANPFMSDPDHAGAVWTYGHRNVQGIATHPDTGEIWATEHGARGGDELNRIERGTYYGWPEVTYSREYWGPRISDETSMEGARDPEVVWTPCIAPSGLAFYTGDAISDWKGDLFAGGLVLRQVRRLDFEDGKIVGEETLQFDERIRDVVNGPDGYLYVVTDEDNGKVMRIEAK
jgi:glucose/arabinose dehydrogenase